MSTQLGSEQVIAPAVSDAQAVSSTGNGEQNGSAVADAVALESSPAQPQVDPNANAANWRKSDKEWQQMVEKSKKADELIAKLSSLGAQPEQGETQEQMIERVLSSNESLKYEIESIRWEQDHPIVRDPKYKEAWENVKSDSRFKELTFDEKLKLIYTPDATAMKEALLTQVQKVEGSVQPSVGSPTTGPKRPSAELLESGKAWGFTEADYVKAGVF